MQPATTNPRTRFILTLVGLLLLGIAVPAWPVDSPEERATLKGIKAIVVAVDVNPEAEPHGLSKDQIQTDVELRLRKAGIKVVSLLSEGGSSFLSVAVAMVKSSDGSVYAYSIQLAFNQLTVLMRDPRVPAVATTWSTSYVGLAGFYRVREVRNILADQVDRFINAYLEQNPK